MFDFLKWNQAKLDAAPGTLVYAGKQRDFIPHIVHCAYNADRVSEARIDPDEFPKPDEGCINLFIVTGVHVSATIRDVGTALDLPAICLEDVLNTGQRSKLVWADDETGFIVIRHMVANEDMPTSQQVSIFWRDNMVAVFLEEENDLLSGVLSRIRKGRGRIRRSGATYLMTAVLDAVVDNHMLALSHFSEVAQTLEARLMDSVTDDLLGELYALKRETILLRNALMPVRDIFKTLLMEESEMPDDVLPYLRDAAGHHEQTLEGITSLHDIMKSMIDYQISLIGIRTNRVMQLLTIVATIFIPLTFIAGIYGMNFQNMPELQWEYGYYFVLGTMAVVGAGMVLYFNLKKFL